jgi:hypothetical protein
MTSPSSAWLVDNSDSTPSRRHTYHANRGCFGQDGAANTAVALEGKTYMGVERSTFVINADGNVTKVMRNVKPAEHADDMLAALSG